MLEILEEVLHAVLEVAYLPIIFLIDAINGVISGLDCRHECRHRCSPRLSVCQYTAEWCYRRVAVDLPLGSDGLCAACLHGGMDHLAGSRGSSALGEAS